MRLLLSSLCALSICLLATSPVLAAKVSLSPSNDRSVSRRVAKRMTVEGHVKTPQKEGKALALDLSVSATLDYVQRRLPGLGRGALALRALRNYTTAEAEITVDEQQTNSTLRSGRRMLVVEAGQAGLEHVALTGPLTFAETELLKTPGDVLALEGLLPLTSVEIGDEWEPESWVAQVLTGIDAVLEQSVTCRLRRLTSTDALIEFEGKIEGAHLGASTEISIAGELTFDRDGKYVRRGLLMQREKRTVGAISPGLDLTATVKISVARARTSESLDDDAVEAVPLDIPKDRFRLEFRSPWNVSFRHARDWHVFQQTSRVAVVRLMDQGTLISQFNVSPITSVSPGQRTDQDQFVKDIATTLGERLKEVSSVEDLKLDDGIKAHEVIVSGDANGTKMQWRYYLCTAPSGKQAAFVFAVEEKLADDLADRPREIIESVRFTSASSGPTRAD